MLDRLEVPRPLDKALNKRVNERRLRCYPRCRICIEEERRVFVTPQNCGRTGGIYLALNRPADCVRLCSAGHNRVHVARRDERRDRQRDRLPGYFRYRRKAAVVHLLLP